MAQTPIAGSKLGLTRRDLLNLLFPEEEQDLGGFLSDPVKKSSEPYAPKVPLTGTFMSKGRGNVLGYQQGGSPTLEISGELEEVVPLIPGATGGLGGVENLPGARGIENLPEPAEPQVPVVQEKADRLLSSFIGELGDPTGKAIGAMGVGRAMEYGYTKPEILEKARQEGMSFGGEAARGLGVSSPSRSSSPSTNLSSFVGPQGTSGYMGQQAVKRAKASGLSESQIRSMASQQGMKFGSNVSF